MKYILTVIVMAVLITGCDHSPTRSGDVYKDAWWKSDKKDK